MPNFRNLVYLRERIEEARTRAAGTDDPLVKAAFLQLAEAYGALLAAIETKLPKEK
jgi:hypothetical protein